MKANELRIGNLYGNYDISVDGIVTNKKTGAIIKHRANDKGYPCVSLSIEGKGYFIRVHRMMAHKFIPNPDNKPCVNHKDRNRANFNIENLEWVTNSENVRHSVDNGGRKNFKRDNTGNRNANARLRDFHIRPIFDLHRLCGYSQNELSKIFDVQQQCISKILNKKTWKSVALTGEELTIK